MWGKVLCLGLIGRYGTDALEAEKEIHLMRKTGFEGFFSGWGGLDYLKRCRAAAKAEGMIYQSVHAPFKKARDLWHGTPEAARAGVEELVSCLRDCAEVGVDLMIAHTFIGFEDHAPNSQGLDNYEQVIRQARSLGVRIAFENTEGLEYLDAVMDLCESYADCTGFCWDTGHEMCYNHSIDMPGRYPGRLIGTHINDNLGIRDLSGEITWIDDLHLLPFDGIGDWDDIARRLSGFAGPLTFELGTSSLPDRHDNDKYGPMGAERYLAEAYARACRVAALVRRHEGA